MKKIKKLFVYCLCAAMIMACLPQLNVEAVSKAKLQAYTASIKETSTTKKIDGTYYVVKGKKAVVQLGTIMFDQNINAKYMKVTEAYKTSNKKIVAVSKNGKLTAKKTGTVKIRVSVTSQKSKKVKKSTLTKMLKVKVVTQSVFNKLLQQEANRASTEKKTSTTPSTDTSSGGSTTPTQKSRQQILDEMTSADGTLTLTEEFLKQNGYFDRGVLYNIPNEFTKATKVVLPRLSGHYEYRDTNLRDDVTYVIYQNPDNIEIYFDTYDRTKCCSSNEYNISTKQDFFQSSKMYSYQYVGFCGYESEDITTLTIQKKNSSEIKKFKFIVKADKTSKGYLYYRDMKSMSAEALKDCTTTWQKVEALAYLVKGEKLTPSGLTYNYDCGWFAYVMDMYCNMNGIPCVSRAAGYDIKYGQTTTHVNNLLVVDGEPYVFDVQQPQYGITTWKYSQYNDINGYYKDYTNVRGTNLKGTLDLNITKGYNPEYAELLKNCGYNVQIICDGTPGILDISDETDYRFVVE